jgi:hypothetical protein
VVKLYRFGDNLSKETIMAGMEIITVEGGSELKDFIDLPWRIYAEYPNWVPPLKKEVRRLLDPHRHPFWESAERILFLVRRGSETVGRITGIIDRHYNQFHNEKIRRPRQPSFPPWRRGFAGKG